MDQSTLDFIMLFMAVVSAFFFIPWLASKLASLYPRDPFRFKNKQYDRFSF